MSHSKQKQIVYVLLFIFFSFITTHTVYAQSSAGIKLLPVEIDKTVSPNDTFTENITVQNLSDQDKDYYLYKRNISGVEDGGVPLFAQDDAEKTGYELTDWFTIQTEPIHVLAHGSYVIPVSFAIPSTVTPGSHFGAVFISAEPPKLRENGAGVGFEVATIINFRVSGIVSDEARIRSLSTDKLFYSSKEVSFSAKIENKGNILIRPHGPLTITSMFGGTAKVISVNDNLAGVFPGTVRDYVFNWKETGLGFGRYEAVLALVYDGNDGQKTIDATTVFWIFPANVIISIIIGAIVLIVLGYFGTKYYINQAIIRASAGRRLPTKQYRRQVGVSRLTFVMITLMAIVALFLIVLLIFFA